MDCKFIKRPVTASNSIKEKRRKKTSLLCSITERLKYNLIATTMAVCLASSSSSSRSRNNSRSRRRLRAKLPPPLLVLLALASVYLLFRCFFPPDTSYRKSVRLQSTAYPYKHFLGGRNGFEILLARFLPLFHVLPLFDVEMCRLKKQRPL